MEANLRGQGATFIAGGNDGTSDGPGPGLRRRQLWKRSYCLTSYTRTTHTVLQEIRKVLSFAGKPQGFKAFRRVSREFPSAIAPSPIRSLHWEESEDQAIIANLGFPLVPLTTNVPHLLESDLGD